MLRKSLRTRVPSSVLRWYESIRNGRKAAPPVGRVDWGDLRRLAPLSNWGWERGLPIDRYYIEQFLSARSEDIHGHVLEIQDPSYTRKFGGLRVRRADVLHVTAGNPQATIVADLSAEGSLPADTYDCIICTQTLQQIYAVESAITTLHRALKPGGVLLATVSGISQIDRPAMEKWGDYWRFTTRGLTQLFLRSFHEDYTSVKAYGNVLTSTAFLYGLATEELSADDLSYHDPDYQLLIAVRAVKPLE
jgi:SAM-dependent methyltransferase